MEPVLVEQQMPSASDPRILRYLREGMPVYDVDRHPLGVIRSVYLEGWKRQGAVVSPALIPTICGTFCEDERLPELLYVRLSRTGFAKVAPIPHARGAYYVTPGQVQTISSGSITLAVPKAYVLTA